MRKEKVIFTGSAMDGIYGENLVSWCGLSLSDEDQDKIAESINEIDLLMRCPSIDYYEKEGPDIPRFSDTFYKFVVYSPEEEENLKEELKEEILSVIKEYDEEN